MSVVPMTATGEQPLPVLIPTHEPLVYFLSPVQLKTSDRAALLGTGVQLGSTHHTSLNTLGPDTHKLFNYVQ